MMLSLPVPDPYLCVLCERVVRGPADPTHDFHKHVTAVAAASQPGCGSSSQGAHRA